MFTWQTQSLFKRSDLAFSLADNLLELSTDLLMVLELVDAVLLVFAKLRVQILVDFDKLIAHSQHAVLVEFLNALLFLLEHGILDLKLFDLAFCPLDTQLEVVNHAVTGLQFRHHGFFVIN